MRKAIMLAALGLFPGMATAATAATGPEAPVKKELFAGADWYQGQAGKEQAFEGTLQREERGLAPSGFGRFNPYRLVMESGTREVYTGSEGALLEPYLGKKVRLTGKAVDMEVEGHEHHEIWPARLEVLGPAQPTERKADG